MKHQAEQLQLFFEPTGAGKYVEKAGGYFVPGKMILVDREERETVTVAEAMARLRYSKSQIHYLCEVGELDFEQRGKGCKKRITRRSVEAMAMRMRDHANA